ncbi:spore germination protein [Paenibacillus solisilvae]|uniref:Spore germination protein n=1 Tax=Paenibacillus solisilvae TaxID=2486751 RepID=A0ABW0VZY2_9BACL
MDGLPETITIILPSSTGYVEGAVDPETLAEFIQRINKAKDMEILETSYIEELLEDWTYSPFPQFRFTERPDTKIHFKVGGH